MLQSACNTSFSVSKYLSGRSLHVCDGKWLCFLCARYHSKELQAHLQHCLVPVYWLMRGGFLWLVVQLVLPIFFSCISDINSIDCVPHKTKIAMQESHNWGCAFYRDSSSIWDHKLKWNCSLFYSYLTFLCARNDSRMSSSNMQSVWVMDNKKVTEVWQTKLEIYWQSNVTKLVHGPRAFILPFNLFPNSILIHKTKKIL